MHAHSYLIQQRQQDVPDVIRVFVGGVFQKLPEALYDLVEDVLPQSLIHVLRVRKLDVGQDGLLVEPQQVCSGKQRSGFATRTVADPPRVSGYACLKTRAFRKPSERT